MRKYLIIILLIIQIYGIYDLKKCILSEINNIKQLNQEENILKNHQKYIGKFNATFYCSCPKCVGNKRNIKTATGNIPIANKTIAVDTNIIPLHSIVYIKGMGFYVAEDTGANIKGRRIDIFVNNHNEALQLGKKQVEVYKVF